jgi:hypothetical protein
VQDVGRVNMEVLRSKKEEMGMDGESRWVI